MDPETIEVQQALDEAFDMMAVLEPGSPAYPDDDLITPGEFDIA